MNARFTLPGGVLILIAAAVAPAGAQGSFEGLVAYRMWAYTGAVPNDIRYFQKTGALRQEYDMNGTLAGAMIYTSATGETIVLMPDQKTYIVMSGSTATSKPTKGGKTTTSTSPGVTGTPTIDWSTVKVTATGQRETVAGIACDHYTFAPKGSTDVVDICGASGMGFFVLGGDATSSGSATLSLMKSTNPVLANLVSKGFFALKATMTSGANKMMIEATAVDRRVLDPALFKPPADYTKIAYP